MKKFLFSFIMKNGKNVLFSDIEIKDDIFESEEYLDDSENYSAVDSIGKCSVLLRMCLHC